MFTKQAQFNIVWVHHRAGTLSSPLDMLMEPPRIPPFHKLGYDLQYAHDRGRDLDEVAHHHGLEAPFPYTRIQAKWILALLSGDYPAGDVEYLHLGGNWSAMGVACDLLKDKFYVNSHANFTAYDGYARHAPSNLVHYLGNKPLWLSDTDFPALAQKMMNNPKEYFHG